jgi:hypothetical protein
MIVAFQPGGNIRAARVVLKPDETVPTRYNTPEAIVFREGENGGPWILVKPQYSVLPADSPLLSQPVLPDITLPTTMPEGNDFEHNDIIRIDDDTIGEIK